MKFYFLWDHPYVKDCVLKMQTLSFRLFLITKNLFLSVRVVPWSEDNMKGLRALLRTVRCQYL